MRAKLPAFATDQQRLTRAGRTLLPQAAPLAGDQAVSSRGAAARVAARSQAKGAVVMSPEATLVVAPISAVAASWQQLPVQDNPGQNRARIARGMSGIPYRQELGQLRSASTPEALAYMDCSEFVARVLAAAGLTPSVQAMDSKGLLALLSDKSKFVHSDSPRVGDIALWASHTGIVGAVETGGTMKLIHAKGLNKDGTPKLSGENLYAITPAQYLTGSYFYGYYRPVAEGTGGGPATSFPAKRHPTGPAKHQATPKAAALSNTGSIDPADALAPLPSAPVLDVPSATLPFVPPHPHP